MNFWLRLSTTILNDLFKLTNKNVKLELVILIFGTLYVIVAIMQFFTFNDIWTFNGNSSQ